MTLVRKSRISWIGIVFVSTAITLTAPIAARAAGSYQCQDHPDVILDHPGECPIDGKPLVAMQDDGPSAAKAEAPPAKKQGKGKILFYRNPMNPTITSPVPAKDDMGMDYVPVYENQVNQGGGATVTIDGGIVQNMNVTTEMAVRKDVERSIRTVGYLDYDQEKMVSVTTKYRGFIEKVFVNYVGQPVRKGQPLFTIYSPELVQTEQELLSALEYVKRLADAPQDTRSRAEALLDAARQRMAYWDITKRQIERLEKTGRVFRTLTVVAPSKGIVMKRMKGLEGMAVKPAMDLMHIVDLSTLWLSVEVFEEQLAWVNTGSEAEITFTYFPGETFHGEVRYIEPAVSERTRSLRLTLEIPNPDERLRVKMYATVLFHPVAARNVITVPSQALIRTGTKNVVIVAEGEGHFTPREVKLGAEGPDFVEVRSGVNEGDEIVTSAQFLLDSESNLQAAIQKLIASRKK